MNESLSDAYRNVRVSMLPVRVVLIAISALALGVLAWCFFGQMTDKEYMRGVVFPSEGTNGVNIPNTGVVKTVFVHKGDKVSAGQSLALVSVSGAYSIVSAPCEGVVLSYIPENEGFEAFEDIVDLLPDSASGPVRSVTAFADFNAKRFLAPGQTAQVTPANETRERVGYVRGKVVHVSEYPVSKREAVLKLQNASLADEIFPDKSSVFEVDDECRPFRSGGEGIAMEAHTLRGRKFGFDAALFKRNAVISGYADFRAAVGCVRNPCA